VAGIGDFNTGDTSSWFKMVWATTEEEIRQAASSKYCQVHHGDTLLKINELPYEKVAVVALPCTAQAIYSARLNKPVLEQKIRYVFSLVCGHTVGAQFLSYLAKRNNIQLDQVRGFHFRDKTNITDSANFNFRFDHGDGRSSYLNFGTTDVVDTWSGLLFSLNRCLFCNDFTGRYADASFADVWLPEYRKDVNGHTFMLTRNNEIQSALDTMSANKQIHYSNSTLGDFVRAQLPQIKFKDEQLFARVKVSGLLGLKPKHVLIKEVEHKTITYGLLVEAMFLLLKVKFSKFGWWQQLNAKGFNRIFRLLEYLVNPLRFYEVGISKLRKLRPKQIV
jgi:coenzyme F420-reducing hydrogenase beta subunit